MERVPAASPGSGPWTGRERGGRAAANQAPSGPPVALGRPIRVRLHTSRCIVASTSTDHKARPRSTSQPPPSLPSNSPATPPHTIRPARRPTPRHRPTQRHHRTGPRHHRIPRHRTAPPPHAAPPHRTAPAPRRAAPRRRKGTFPSLCVEEGALVNPAVRGGGRRSLFTVRKCGPTAGFDHKQRSSPCEPSPAEPSPAEPRRAQPNRAPPSPAQPCRAQPSHPRRSVSPQPRRTSPRRSPVNRPASITMWPASRTCSTPVGRMSGTA